MQLTLLFQPIVADLRMYVLLFLGSHLKHYYTVVVLSTVVSLLQYVYALLCYNLYITLMIYGKNKAILNLES